MRPNRILRLAFCVGLTVAGAPGAPAKSPLSLDIVERDGYGVVPIMQAGKNGLLVPTSIEGQNVKLLLDTGWGLPGITLSLLPAQVKLVPSKINGTVRTASGSGSEVRVAGLARSVTMGNVRLSDVPVVVGSFRGLSDIHSPVLGAVGFIGRGFLQTNSAIIDLTNLRLYLRPPGKGRKVDLGNALRGVGMGEASFAEMTHGNYLVNVEFNGVPGKMILDTGAFGTLIDSRFAKQASAHGWGRRVEGIDAAGVRTAADFASTKSFKVGGYQIRSPIVTLTNFPYYTQSGGKVVGLLGMDVLGQNWGIIDFGQKKLYFASGK